MKIYRFLSTVAASLTTVLGAYSAHACISTATAQAAVNAKATANPAIGTATPTNAITFVGNGWRQAYTKENANIWISQCDNTGAHIVQGVIEDEYVTADGGGDGTVLGYPVSDEQETPSGDGRMSFFESGGILFSSVNDTKFTVHGFIWDRYFNMNTTLGGLGYPTSEEQAFSNSFFSGRISDMQNGSIVFDSALSGEGVLASTWPVFSVNFSSAGGVAGVASDTTDTGGTVQVTVGANSILGKNAPVTLFLDNFVGRTQLQTGTTSATGALTFLPESFDNTDAGGGNSTSGFVVTLEVANSAGTFVAIGVTL
jgi:LGFP repeat